MEDLTEVYHVGSPFHVWRSQRDQLLPPPLYFAHSGEKVRSKNTKTKNTADNN